MPEHRTTSRPERYARHSAELLGRPVEMPLVTRGEVYGTAFNWCDEKKRRSDD
jgi:hypothetical protein